MISLETSGGWVASLMSERIVMTGVRSRRFRIGSSRRTSEWPIWPSGIWRPSRLISEKSARRAGSSRSPPALRATMGTLRMSSRTCVTGDAGKEELELLAHLRRREADEVQPILIRDEAEHGRAIAPIAIRLPHVGNAPHDVEGFFGDGVQLQGSGPMTRNSTGNGV